MHSICVWPEDTTWTKQEFGLHKEMGKVYGRRAVGGNGKVGDLPMLVRKHSSRISRSWLKRFILPHHGSHETEIYMSLKID